MSTSTEVVRTRKLEEAPDLISFLPDDGWAWLHENEGFVAWGEAARIEVGTGTDRFHRAEAELQRFFRSLGPLARSDCRAPLAIGSFTFDPEDAGSVLVVPRITVEVRDGRGWATAIGEEIPDLSPRFERSIARMDKVRYQGSSVSEIAWLDLVTRATDEISKAAFEKVVLARDVKVWSEAPFDLPGIVAKLALRFPGCFTFAADGLVGASPELLVERTGSRVRSTVLAGSAQRGRNEAEDATHGNALLASSKDVHEHELAAQTVRDALGPLCSELAESGPSLLKLANVQHLATDFVGRLTSDGSALELAGALHPTAAVGGVPRAEALSFIAEHEGLDRGRYSGPVGWVDAAGDGEWAIALRCAELRGDRGRLFAGGGVVEGSMPEEELEETRLKLRAMESVLGDG